MARDSSFGDRTRATALATSLSLAAAFFFPSIEAARAQGFDEEEEPAPAPTPPAAPSPSSFAGALGAQSVQRALRSIDPQARAAAVARASELQSEDGWRLVEAAAADNLGPDADGSLEVRLAAARALASDPRKLQAISALRALFFAPVPSLRLPAPVAARTANDDLLRLLRETAALALSRQGEEETLFASARGRADGEGARAATAILRAYPPTKLPNASDVGALPRDTIDLFARLGDLRAADALARAANGKDEATAATALVGLAALGDMRAVSIAASVLRLAKAPLNIAAAEALAELGDPRAEAAIAALLSSDDTALEGRRLAVAHPSSAWLPRLEAFARDGDAAATAALASLGAQGVTALTRFALGDDEVVADCAAYALAVCPGDDAAAAIAALLGDQPREASGPRPSPRQRRRAVRAGAVRLATFASAPRAIRSAANDLARSADAADRWVGVLLASVADPSAAAKFLRSDDQATRLAAAVALSANSSGSAIAREHLSTHGSAARDATFAAILATAAVGDVGKCANHDVSLSTPTLVAWLGDAGPTSAIAAYLLAARGGEDERPSLSNALGDDDFSIRAAALLGLGATSHRFATGELVSRILHLATFDLRKASVRALSARGDPAGRAMLETIRALDPASEVRALALVGGSRHSPLVLGREVVQARIVDVRRTRVESIAATPAPNRPVLAKLMRSDGLAVPVVADPDGIILAFGVPAGPSWIDVPAAESWRERVPGRDSRTDLRPPDAASSRNR